VVENGQVRLPPDVCLPENVKVYVVVPDVETRPLGHIASPRLVHPQQAEDFRMEVIEEDDDAGL
jgi:hypothetical protein